MEIDAMLCDHAEAAEGKLFINGAGISMMNVGPMVPHVLNFGVAAIVRVPYTATNQPHKIAAVLVDQDGEAVVPWQPEGAPPAPEVRTEATFNVGRPPHLTPGDEQPVPLAFALPGLPVSAPGQYSVRLDIDGTEVCRLPFRVVVNPAFATMQGQPMA